MDATTAESIIAMPLSAAATNNNNNMSCGSSSSSSNSSGYASATTPTNPASAGSSSNHSQYSDSHSSTPVGLVEPTPVATIAAVTPYYNETFQQQQQQQHHQQQQQHQPQLHHPPHPQYQLQTHSYQLPEQLPTSSQYDNTYDPYACLSGGEGFQQSVGGGGGDGGERNLWSMRHTTTYYTTLEKPSKPPTQTAMQPQSNTANNNNSNSNKIYNNSNSETPLHTPKRIGESNTPAKPQAAATPFYAHSAQTAGSSTYGEPIKYRMSTAPKLPTLGDYMNYGNQPLDISNTMNYTQNFPQHHAGKPLHDLPYGATAAQVKAFNAMPNTRLPQQRLGMHYGNTAMPVGIPIGSASNNSNSNNNNSSIYIDKYDKYLYTAVTTVAQSPYYTSTPPANLSAMPYNAVTYAAAPPASTTVPPQYAAEMPNDTYRKSTAASSWHWSMEYANGNCRSLPPPPNGIPTAAIPPTNASYVPSNTTAANRDIYYTSEKYGNKYDKYNAYYNPHQQYMTSNATGRSAWSNSPHASAHLVPPALAERLSHPYPHHAPLPTSGVPNTLAPSAHPSLAYHHPYTPSAGTAAARQNCCSQPFQQQNCYYPRTTHHPHVPLNAYSPHVQTPPYGATGTAVGSNNSAVVKYNLLDYGPVSKSKVNTNDVYATTPPYEASNMNYHSHPAGMASSPQYANAAAPTAVVGHPPLNRNITPSSHSDIAAVYYNDLNMQSSYDNYLGPIQPTSLVEERRESLVQRVDHLPNLPPTYTQTTSTKNSLIDYRKPAVTPNDDCFIAEPTLTNLDEHMATNMSQNQYDNSYGIVGEQRSNADDMYSKTSTRESAVKPGSATPTTPTTKTYSSLRDFLSTWNEDEEDYGCTDDLQFVENAPQAIEQVMHTENNTKCAEVITKMSSGLQELTNKVNTPESYDATDVTATYRTKPLPFVVNNLQLKEAYNSQPKAQASIGPVNTINMAENQYANINLPDIIIDIEKSGGVAPNITNTPKTNTANKSSVRDVGYDCFDVEKELDELETKRVKIPKLSADTIPIRNGSVIMKAATEALGVVSPNATVETEILKTIENIKSIQPVEKDFLFAEHRADNALSTVQTKTEIAYDRNIESDNTTSSNSSTFEKEYETFINKIGNEFDYKIGDNKQHNFTLDANDKSAQSEITTDIAKVNPVVPPNVLSNTMVKQCAVNDMEIAQKIKSFSKFYKRKRKSSEMSKGKDACKMLKQSHELESVLNKEINLPVTFVKRCRRRKSNNRINSIRSKCIQRRKNRDTYFYQHRLRALRRYWVRANKRLDIKAMLKDDMVLVSEKNLPLNDLRSITQYLNGVGNDFKQYFNPKTLKCLSVSFINSEAFQNKLLKDVDTGGGATSKDLNTNEESKSVSLNAALEKEQNYETSFQTTENIDNQIYNEISSPVTLETLAAENNFDVNMSNTFEENVQQEYSNKTSEIEELVSAVSQQSAEQTQITEFEPIEDTQHNVDSKDHTEVDMALPTTWDVKDSKNEFDSTESGDFKEEFQSADYSTKPRDDGVEASIEQLMTDDKHDDGDILDNKEFEPQAYDADISADNETETLKSLSTDIPDQFSELNTSENLMDILESQFNANKSVEYKATDVESLLPLSKDVINEVNPTEDHVNQVNDDVQITKQQTIMNDFEKIEEEKLEAMDLTWATAVEEDSVNNPKTELNECAFSGTHDDTRLTEVSNACSSSLLEGASKDAEYSARKDDSHSTVIAMKVAESPFKNLNSTSPVHMKNEISPDITMLKAFDLEEQTNEPQQCFGGNVDLSDMENSLDMFGARRSAEYFTATSKNYFEKTGVIDENSTDSNSSSSSDSSSSSSGRRSSTSSSSSPSSSSDENSQSSITTVQSDFNEMKELERELSQHQANEAAGTLELENDEKSAAATYIDDNNSDGVYINSSKTITENDIKTLKQILESDSDGQEEIRTNREVVKGESFEDEEINADINTSILQEQHADTVNDIAEDDKQVQNEDSNPSNGVTNVTMPTAEHDCVGTEVMKECRERRDNACDVDGSTHELAVEAVEENQSQNETLFCAAINLDDDGSGVPSLKRISLDYLERVTSNEDHTLSKRTEDALNSKIPKLSDLCKNALSSSFEISANNNNSISNNNTNQNTPETLERELSVEEALAEMYRQAGVTSDPEDGDAEEREAQDVVLINLEEILVNDSDLYVLQCDMNENVLSVVAHAQAPDLPMQVDESIEDIERAVNAEMPTDDLMNLESPQAEVIVTDNMQNDFLGPFVNVHADLDNTPTTVPLTPYITPPHTVDYVEDELRNTNDDSLNTQFDFPAIHHEEIVSHDYKRLKRQVLYNSLREKYVLKRIHFRPHHGNRVLKKYIHRWILQCLIARFRERELRKAHIYDEV